MPYSHQRKPKPSVSRKARRLPESSHKNSSKRASKQSSAYINANKATHNKFEILNKTKRRFSSVKKDIKEQLQKAQDFMKMLTASEQPVLTHTHLMNVKYDEFENIIIIDNQNVFYASDITGYKTPRDMVLDLAQTMGHWNLFIIVKPKLDPKQLDYYQDKDNANIITFNIECATLNDGRLQKCHEVHGFNETDDYLLLLLYKYFSKHNTSANSSSRSPLNVSILSGDNYKHTQREINYFYLNEKLKTRKFNQHTYYEQFSKWVLTQKLTDQIQDDIGWD
jgi:hypothetical protein